MQWLCLDFPLLAIEALCDANEISAQLNINDPIAVIDHQRVICANQSAVALGVRLQQSMATVYALSDNIRVIERQENQEQQKLEQLAFLLYPFSPQLNVSYPRSLLIEIGSSLILFGGLSSLLTQIKQRLSEWVIHYKVALAPFPEAAKVLALSGQTLTEEDIHVWQSSRVSNDAVKETAQKYHRSGSIHQKGNGFNDSFIEKNLHRLSIDTLLLPEKTKQQLHSIGIRDLGQLLSFPHQSILKRFGQHTLDYCLILTGRKPLQMNYYTPPLIFQRSLDFIDVIHKKETLLFPMKRMLKELIVFFRQHQKTSQTLEWLIQDHYQLRKTLTIQLVASCHQERSLLELTQLQLESFQLSAPIERLSLTVSQLVDVEGMKDDLFAYEKSFDEQLGFINKIRAKLGKDSCLQLTINDDIAPEQASQQRLVAFNQTSSTTKKANTKRNSLSQKKVSDNNRKQAFKVSTLNQTSLPIGLFNAPIPINKYKDQLYWQGQLTILSTEQRLTHYWWQKPIVRDYYIAEHVNGCVYWIFQDKYSQQWYIHGVFS